MKKPTITQPRSAADELKQLEYDRVAALTARDVDRVADILSDSWVSFDWDGSRQDKSAVLADLKKPVVYALDSIEMGPMTVRIYGDTAIVFGSDTEKSKDHGKDTSGTYVWTDVFVKENGKWKAVASQVTKVLK